MKNNNITKKLIQIALLTFLVLGNPAVLTARSESLSKKESLQLKGDYLGMKLPGQTPEVFAPGIVSTGFHEHSFITFSPDGKEAYWATNIFDNFKYRFPEGILGVRSVGGIWSKPEYVSFDLNGKGSNPCFSPDEKKIFFIVFKRKTDGKWMSNIWFVSKSSSSGWTDAKMVPGSVNTDGMESQVSVTINNTLYFRAFMKGVKSDHGIYRSIFKNGKYMKPEPLPEQINSKAQDWTPFISSKEDYLLWSSYREGGFGSGDLYICFRSKEGKWSKSVNLGPSINREDNERFPSVSPDGKYLFFLTDKVSEELKLKKKLSFEEVKKYFSLPGNGMCDIHWVKADIIKKLRSEFK